MREEHKRASHGSRWRHSGMASARYPPAAIYRLFGLIIPDAASHTPWHSCRWRFWGILRIHRTPFVISPESCFPIFMEAYKHQYADFMTQTRAFWYLFDYFYISKELRRNDIYQENMLIFFFKKEKMLIYMFLLILQSNFYKRHKHALQMAWITAANKPKRKHHEHWKGNNV